MSRYYNFETSDISTIKSDVAKAKRLSNSCTEVLNLDIIRRRRKMKMLINDTFGIPMDNWHTEAAASVLDFIKVMYAAFSVRINEVDFLFTKKPPMKIGDMQSGTYVIGTRLKEIFITSEYFLERNEKKRACTLIHQYICIVHKYRDRYPGGSNKLIDRTSLGIPQSDAINNPYCYQYFASWL